MVRHVSADVQHDVTFYEDEMVHALSSRVLASVESLIHCSRGGHIYGSWLLSDMSRLRLAFTAFECDDEIIFPIYR
jgi:hypothetical protein